ncbi:hypothetical protein DBZ36_09675 [Alginatibacterium sediminis]|uniref:PilZ domain-containing protein n=1 Tax=Alginatibacterium sediminis TaxID=2164068 RepID=A0A420EDB4_9ALTE|nr:hypothetical protein [Alginatibacterium sediminis]RKF18663.1 hypothetical protein DBZ36_09675 [Alginatibacterium sediminis]
MAGDDRRNYYRVAYPVRLVQLLVQMANRKIDTIHRVSQSRQKKPEAKAHSFLPIMYFGDHRFPVLDLSEGGFRVQWRSSAEDMPMEHKRVIGKIVFHRDLVKLIDYLPEGSVDILHELVGVYGKDLPEHQFEARIVRKIQNKRDPYPQICFQFTRSTRIPTRLIRQQDKAMIKLFQEQYLDRVRERRRSFVESQNQSGD